MIDFAIDFIGEIASKWIYKIAIKFKQKLKKI